jgi:hypothetical protein
MSEDLTQISLSARSINREFSVRVSSENILLTRSASASFREDNLSFLLVSRCSVHMTQGSASEENDSQPGKAAWITVAAYGTTVRKVLEEMMYSRPWES